MDTKPSGQRRKLIPFILLASILINLSLAAWFGWHYFNRGQPLFALSGNAPTALPASSATPSATPIPLSTKPVPMPSPQPILPTMEGLQQQGVIVLSMKDGNFSHLFIFHPQYLSLTRLTNSPWDDITPALSPDGSKLAFSSRQNGYWDIFVLDLSSNLLTRLTDTPEYDANPSWSPDGQWLVFESYIGDNLEILIKSTVDLSQSAIRLTENQSADFSPVWSPQGREIAFVSTQSGDEEIWLARLDQVDERFVNLSHSPQSQENCPRWSPDGNLLAWVSSLPGNHTIMTLDRRLADQPPRPIGIGDQPAWSPDGAAILAVLEYPNQTALTAYQPGSGVQLFPQVSMPASVQGVDWRADRLPEALSHFVFPAGATDPIPRLWNAALSANPLPPGGRFGIVPLTDVNAPYPYLHDEVDESFNALRAQVALEAGWDALASLENAYLPLTTAPSPEMVENWLYTGRAFAINPLPLQAKWMVLVREEYNGLTYWRVYLRARYQDGSQGAPLNRQPWNLNARYSGDPISYDLGGRYDPIPPGYWVDLTEIARRYGWERLPALVNWRTYYAGARFNQFVLSGGLDWYRAMAEVYPPEALITPTLRPTFTPTVTETPEFFGLFTATPTPPPTETPTRRPTWTPFP